MDNKFFLWVSKLINILTVFIFISMTVIAFSQVVLRYLFDSNIHWADEFTRFGMVWIAFLGAALGIKYGDHTRIDFFIKLLPKQGRMIIEIINKIISMFFLGIVAFFSITSLETMMTLKTPSLQIPLGIVHIVIPITSIIMILFLIFQTFEIFKNRDEKGDPII